MYSMSVLPCVFLNKDLNRRKASVFGEGRVFSLEKKGLISWRQRAF